MPRDILQVSDEITPRSAGVPQREGSARQSRSLRPVRDRGERTAESGARVREAIDQPDRRRRAEPGRMAQRSRENRRPRSEIDRQSGRQTGGDHARSFRTRGQLRGVRGTRLCRPYRR